MHAANLKRTPTPGSRGGTLVPRPRQLKQVHSTSTIFRSTANTSIQGDDRIKGEEKHYGGSSRIVSLVSSYLSGSASSVESPEQAAVAADVPEAVSMSHEQGPDAEQGEEEFVWVEEDVEVDVEEVIEVPTFRPMVSLRNAGEFLTVTNLGRGLSLAGLALFAATIFIAMKRAYAKTQTAQAKRIRMVDRNNKLVTELGKILPQERSKLDSSLIKRLQTSLGFTSIEVFRKFMWYVLRERKFDQEAVNDLVALKHAAGMTDRDVAEAIKERAERIYQKYGTLMLNTEGFTAAGLERKATCKSLSQKLLYLAECEDLVKPETEAAAMIDLRTIFGATEEDMIKLRIVSLHPVDLEGLFEQSSLEDTDVEDDEKEKK